ncbi:hypothetical protein GCM10023204_01990 [Actinomycetospora succinea]
MSHLVAWAQPHDADQGRVGSRSRLGASRARVQYHRALFLVLGAWALVTCAAALLYPPLALVAAVLGLIHIIVGYRVEQKRRVDEQPPSTVDPRRA